MDRFDSVMGSVRGLPQDPVDMRAADLARACLVWEKRSLPKAFRDELELIDGIHRVERVALLPEGVDHPGQNFWFMDGWSAFAPGGAGIVDLHPSCDRRLWVAGEVTGDEFEDLHFGTYAWSPSPAMLSCAVRVWRYRECPQPYKAEASQGGDEDWVSVLPAGADDDLPWTVEGTSYGVCSVETVQSSTGELLVVGTHS